MRRNKGKNTVTLKDIAMATGFSANTVSRALADKPEISEETKKIIRDKAAEMGYIANALASFLRSGVSRNIAIIVGDISNPHFSVMVKEMQVMLQNKGYNSIIFNTEEKEDMERQAITISISQNVDGIIICPVQGGEENIRYLQTRGKPYVLIGRRFAGLDTNYVVCDDEQGGYIATRHLLDNGHRNILFLNGPKGISSTVERLQGYRRALEECAVPFRKELVKTVPITMGKGREKMRRILEQEKEVTAILAFSDILAWQAISILKELGKKVPQQCSIIGFDNIKYPFPMSLTTISSSKTTMAKKSVEILLRELESPLEYREHSVLETCLIHGDTVAAPEES